MTRRTEWAPAAFERIRDRWRAFVYDYKRGYHLPRWWRRRIAAAWGEGFDAGERDVFEHESSGDWDGECTRNPYRGGWL